MRPFRERLKKEERIVVIRKSKKEQEAERLAALKAEYRRYAAASATFALFLASVGVTSVLLHKSAPSERIAGHVEFNMTDANHTAHPQWSECPPSREWDNLTMVAAVCIKLAEYCANASITNEISEFMENATSFIGQCIRTAAQNEDWAMVALFAAVTVAFLAISGAYAVRSARAEVTPAVEVDEQEGQLPTALAAAAPAGNGYRVVGNTARSNREEAESPLLRVQAATPNYGAHE